MNITLELLADYGDYLLDEPGAPVPPPSGLSRAEYLFGAPLLVVAVIGTPLYFAGQILRAVV